MKINILQKSIVVISLLVLGQGLFAADAVNFDDPNHALDSNTKGTQASVVKTGTPNETGYCKECEERAAAAYAERGDACADPLKQFTCNKTSSGKVDASGKVDDGVK